MHVLYAWMEYCRGYLWRWVACICVVWWNRLSYIDRCPHPGDELAVWWARTTRCCVVCRRDSDDRRSTCASLTLCVRRAVPSNHSVSAVPSPSRSVVHEQPQNILQLLLGEPEYLLLMWFKNKGISQPLSVTSGVWAPIGVTTWRVINFIPWMVAKTY